MREYSRWQWSPHGELPPFHQKSHHPTQLTQGPDVVQIWLRNPRNFEATKLEVHRVARGNADLGLNLACVDRERLALRLPVSVWCLVFVVWCLVFGVWGLEFGG